MATKPSIPQKISARAGTGPIALVTKFPVSTCRECGGSIKLGERIWWMRAVGTAHLTCGWTMPNGKVHPGTLSSIRDIPPSASATDPTEYVPLYAQRLPVSRRDKNKGPGSAGINKGESDGNI